MRFWKSLAAVAVIVAAASPVKAETFINILTGGQSGVYYPLGVSLEFDLRRGRARCAAFGAVHQGVGGEPEPRPGREGRDRVHAR